MSDRLRRKNSHDPGEKLQKVLARTGLGSRRALETWIADGRVSVDGKVAHVGDRVRTEQTIRVDGHIVYHAQTTSHRRVLIYHKPEGELCTRDDPKGRPIIFTRLPKLRHGRWINVGRLDFNTAGLLLVTNDGELAHRLMHPSSRIEREYAVRVRGKVSEDTLRQLKKGVKLEDGMARFGSIREAGGEGVNHWYHVILSEGRHREVRRLWQAVGTRVSRLIRIRYGPVTLPRNLQQGRWEDLDDRSLNQLLKHTGLETQLHKTKSRHSSRRRRR